jgi:hypothetical protein
MSIQNFDENLRRIYELFQLLGKNLRKKYKKVLPIFEIVFYKSDE